MQGHNRKEWDNLLGIQRCVSCLKIHSLEEQSWDGAGMSEGVIRPGMRLSGSPRLRNRLRLLAW